jgi:hypothetical protein
MQATLFRDPYPRPALMIRALPQQVEAFARRTSDLAGASLKPWLPICIWPRH